MNKKIFVQDKIENLIYYIHGHRVMLDFDLAKLYGIQTRNLNKAVSRNSSRFPQDFMFTIQKEELQNLMFQNGTSSWGGTRKPARVFTEHGILMLSSVLRSERAVEVNIAIMRAFVRLRQFLSTNKELALKLELLEQKSEKHDKGIQAIFKAIRQLMVSPEEKPKRQIGFRQNPSDEETHRQRRGLTTKASVDSLPCGVLS